MTTTVHHCRHHRGQGQGKDPPHEQLLTGVGGSRLRVRGGGGDVAVKQSHPASSCSQAWVVT